MGHGSSRPSRVGPALGFGIEVEMEGKPRERVFDTVRNMRATYQKLMIEMKNRGIDTTMDAVRARRNFRKHHGDYSVWHLTQDNSIGTSSSHHVTVEAVSRIINAENDDWYQELTDFFDAVDEVMVLQYNESCGGHIHMAPSYGDFTLEDLKRIAYAVVVFENHIVEILPDHRRTNRYCRPNVYESPELDSIFKYGRSRETYENLADRLTNDIDSYEELRALMHGDGYSSRYVLWNFNNICGSTGTIEFRGGPQMLSEGWVAAWVGFALAFIKLAIHEDRLAERDFSYVSPETVLFKKRVRELWRRIKRCSDAMPGPNFRLPRSYEMMNETDPDWSYDTDNTTDESDHESDHASNNDSDEDSDHESDDAPNDDSDEDSDQESDHDSEPVEDFDSDPSDDSDADNGYFSGDSSDED